MQNIWATQKPSFWQYYGCRNPYYPFISILKLKCWWTQPIFGSILSTKYFLSGFVLLHFICLLRFVSSYLFSNFWKRLFLRFWYEMSESYWSDTVQFYFSPTAFLCKFSMLSIYFWPYFVSISNMRALCRHSSPIVYPCTAWAHRRQPLLVSWSKRPWLWCILIGSAHIFPLWPRSTSISIFQLCNIRPTGCFPAFSIAFQYISWVE